MLIAVLVSRVVICAEIFESISAPCKILAGRRYLTQREKSQIELHDLGAKHRGIDS